MKVFEGDVVNLELHEREFVLKDQNLLESSVAVSFLVFVRKIYAGKELLIPISLLL